MIFSYRICIVKMDEGYYKLQFTDEEFDTRAKAEAFLRDADQHGFNGCTLTILEIYES
jgi:hypothetical protein